MGLLSTPTVMQSSRYLNLFPSAMSNRIYFCNWIREPKITMNHVKSPLFLSVKVHCSEPPLYHEVLVWRVMQGCGGPIQKGLASYTTTMPLPAYDPVTKAVYSAQHAYSSCATCPRQGVISNIHHWALSGFLVQCSQRMCSNLGQVSILHYAAVIAASSSGKEDIEYIATLAIPYHHHHFHHHHCSYTCRNLHRR